MYMPTRPMLYFQAADRGIAMRNVRVDTTGELRCWHCGCTSFTEKRTFRAKVIGVTVGVATVGIYGVVAPLLTKKKMKCRICGDYNDVGNAQPYKGPLSRRLGTKYGTFVNMFSAAEPDVIVASAYERPGPVDVLAIEPSPVTWSSPRVPLASAPGWHADPHGRHHLRYWDGTRWTVHVSTRGVMAMDPA
jgi:hypothetical protein